MTLGVAMSAMAISMKGNMKSASELPNPAEYCIFSTLGSISVQKRVPKHSSDVKHPPQTETMWMIQKAALSATTTKILWESTADVSEAERAVHHSKKSISADTPISTRVEKHWNGAGDLYREHNRDSVILPEQRYYRTF